jgi:hypothetical protein
VIRDKRASGELSEKTFSFIWFFYFVITEMMPSIAILSVFVEIQRRGKTLSSSQTTGEN